MLKNATLFSSLGVSGDLFPCTYYIVDDITVPADAYLEILPGTQIVFNENTKMFVNGTIVANGTEENPIRFFSESNSLYFR